MKFRSILSTLILFLFIGTALLTSKDDKPKPKTFDEILKHTQEFYKDQVGSYPNTPIRDIGIEWKRRYELRNVLAYCMLQSGNKYITFNHDLINQTVQETGNSDLIFQVIIHEYTHCEGHMGHIQMYGHYMNDGGAPWLSEKEVKQQFKDFLDYYRTFYRSAARDEEDLDHVYALTIEKDKDGNLRTKCTCAACTNIK